MGTVALLDPSARSVMVQPSQLRQSGNLEFHGYHFPLKEQVQSQSAKIPVPTLSFVYSFFLN